MQGCRMQGIADFTIPSDTTGLVYMTLSASEFVFSAVKPLRRPITCLLLFPLFRPYPGFPFSSPVKIGLSDPIGL